MLNNDCSIIQVVKGDNMKFVRLKSNLSDNNIQNRLQYNPEIIEFHLNEIDLLDSSKLVEKIRFLKNLNIRVYLHQPSMHNGKYLDILSEDKELQKYYNESSEILSNICHEENIHSVIHAHYAKTISSDLLDKQSTIKMRKRIQEILSFAADRFVWEDTTQGIFSFDNPYLLDELVKPLDLPLNIDVSHSFIACKGDNGKLQQILESTQKYAKYYHLVDSMGIKHDSLPLGQGKIDWSMVKQYVIDKDFIFEINLKGDHNDCTPMIDSVKYFNKIEVLFS
jgi:hypothetical protein